ncbi:MAG: hypothetical protein ABSG85_05035 [Spirochaetia bacterium]
MNGIIGIARALDFAARKHAGQRRKGLKAESSVNHLTEVALLLAEARMIKLADKIANLYSIAESPPVGWSGQRKRDYVAWAREVAAACGRTNEWLEGRFEAAARALQP